MLRYQVILTPVKGRNPTVKSETVVLERSGEDSCTLALDATGPIGKTTSVEVTGPDCDPSVGLENE
jgi:hypothetical protein